MVLAIPICVFHKKIFNFTAFPQENQCFRRPNKPKPYKSNGFCNFNLCFLCFLSFLYFFGASSAIQAARTSSARQGLLRLRATAGRGGLGKTQKTQKKQKRQKTQIGIAKTFVFVWFWRLGPPKTMLFLRKSNDFQYFSKIDRKMNF